MSTALTCWKDIANYLGKGVRTVQRYERTSGLPVRRPTSRNRGTVFAWPEELDAWMNMPSPETGSNPDSELLQLREKLARFEAEIEFLRHELQARTVEESNPESRPGAFDSGDDTGHRCANLVALIHYDPCKDSTPQSGLRLCSCCARLQPGSSEHGPRKRRGSKSTP